MEEKKKVQPEEELWLASTEGDLATVRRLLRDFPNIDLNWGDPDYRRTPLYRACGHGRLGVVLELLRTPGIDVNKPINQGASPIYIACQQGFDEVVSLLLLDQRVDPNFARGDGVTPVITACENQYFKVLDILLDCPRVQVNSQRNDGVTGLWYAAQEGFQDLVERVLASDQDVNLEARWITNCQTAEQQARNKKHYAIADLLKEYSESPKLVRLKMQKKYSILCMNFLSLLLSEPSNDSSSFLDRKAAKLFSLIMFHCEGLLESPLAPSDPVSRFFSISSSLPIELQMVLCNRLMNSSNNNITRKFSEPAFRELAFLLSNPFLTS